MATVRAHDGDGDVDFDVAGSAEAELVAARWYCYLSLHATCTALRALRAESTISCSTVVLSVPNFYNTYVEEAMSQRRAGRGRHTGACSRLFSLAIVGARPAQDLLLSKPALLHHKSAEPGPYHQARLTLLHGFVSCALVRRDTQAVYVWGIARYDIACFFSPTTLPE
jgi:hypothetical protein